MENVQRAYAVKHKDEDIRAASRSGGVFTAVSDCILENGGTVYGCALDENFTAEHRRAVTKEQRDAFRGSKYIQSRIGDTYKNVKSDLEAGLCVMFSGTPCQVDGLKRYLMLLKVNTEKLVTVDVVCHGVPSPMVWRDYLNCLEKKEGSKIVSVDFRNKKDFGWKECMEKIELENGHVINANNFSGLFYTDYIIRRSCHECKYTSKKRVSDITLADFWGIDKLDKEFNDNKGVSLILLNSVKGKDVFEKVSSQLCFKEHDTDSVSQTSLEHPFYYNKRREVFWNEYRGDKVISLMKKYGTVKKLIYKMVIGTVYRISKKC